MLTVLVTGVGSPGAPGVINSLRGVTECSIRILGVDANPNASGRIMVDDFVTVPVAQDENFIREVHALCLKHKVNVVLPMVTAELSPFSKAAPHFRNAGTVVSVSEPDNLSRTVHKGYLYNTLSAQGISVPRYTVARTSGDLFTAIGDLGFPNQAVCFKPTVSDGSRGFHVLDPKRNGASELFHEKPTSAHLSLEELKRILDGVSEIPEVVVMEYLPGQEYSIDILADHGQILTAVPRLRQSVTSGITTIGVVRQVQDVIEYASQVVAVLRLHGNVGVQVRRDVCGVPKIIEVNPRLQGSVVHCTAAGVNLPYLAVKLALGIPIREDELSIHWETQMIRYWKEVFIRPDGSPYVL